MPAPNNPHAHEPHSYPLAVKRMGSGMVARYGQRPARPATAPAFVIRASAGGTEPGGFVLRTEDGIERKLTPTEASALQSYPLSVHTPTERLNMKALDLFAGTGWGVACQRLGIEEEGVEIMPEAVATREANGMKTIYLDVWDGLDAGFREYDILIASPPCQTFSMAGKGAGRKALDDVIEAISVGAYKDPAALRAFGEKHDPRTALVLTPLAHVWRDRPTYVALEQVPTVLPVWEACAEVMREWGYSVQVAVLNAEQYGVPQTRRRAILVARLDGDVSLPTPTHSRYYSRDPQRLDEGVLPWVSMAEALGWNRDGVEWTGNNKLAHQSVRPLSHPAPTITAGHDSGNRGFLEPDGGFTVASVEQVSVLQSYPTCRGLTDRSAPTITGGGTEAGGAEPIAKYHERYTSAPGWVGSTERLSTDEAATLQSYPPKPFVWKGTKTKQFLQIGNAVPPLLAEAVLAALIA